jgi:hypothetical protein
VSTPNKTPHRRRASTLHLLRCLFSPPLAIRDLGVGIWGSMLSQSVSEQLVQYAHLLLGTLPSNCLRTLYRTVSISRVLESSYAGVCLCQLLTN